MWAALGQSSRWTQGLEKRGAKDRWLGRPTSWPGLASRGSDLDKHWCHPRCVLLQRAIGVLPNRAYSTEIADLFANSVPSLAEMLAEPGRLRAKLGPNCSTNTSAKACLESANLGPNSATCCPEATKVGPSSTNLGQSDSLNPSLERDGPPGVPKVSRAGPDSDLLPSVHTCFNHLLLPAYKTKEKLDERLHTAIQHSTGFGLM